MPPINSETVPGNTSIPTWLLIAAIVVVGIALVWAIKRLIEFGPTVVVALNKSTEAIEDNTEVLRERREDRK